MKWWTIIIGISESLLSNTFRMCDTLSFAWTAIHLFDNKYMAFGATHLSPPLLYPQMCIERKFSVFYNGFSRFICISGKAGTNAKQMEKFGCNQILGYKIITLSTVIPNSICSYATFIAIYWHMIIQNLLNIDKPVPRNYHLVGLFSSSWRRTICTVLKAELTRLVFSMWKNPKISHSLSFKCIQICDYFLATLYADPCSNTSRTSQSAPHW